MRRSTIVTAVKWGLAGLAGLLASQVAVIVGMTFWRRRVHSHPAAFPRTAPTEFPVGHSTATVYTYGEDVFADMLAAIRGARHRVLFESYIFKDDEVGRRFKQALIDAANRGVEVFVI